MTTVSFQEPKLRKTLPYNEDSTNVTKTVVSVVLQYALPRLLIPIQAALINYVHHPGIHMISKTAHACHIF